MVLLDHPSVSYLYLQVMIIFVGPYPIPTLTGQPCIDLQICSFSIPMTLTSTETLFLLRTLTISYPSHMSLFMNLLTTAHSLPTLNSNGSLIVPRRNDTIIRLILTEVEGVRDRSITSFPSLKIFYSGILNHG